MSRFTRAILGAALLAVAVPGVASAATLEVLDTKFSSPHAFKYVAAPGETNNVRVAETADGSTIVSDSAPLRISGEVSVAGCRLDGIGDAICGPNAIPIGFDLGDGNDTIRYLASEPVGRGPALSNGVIDGGSGNDTIFAGIRRNAFGVLDIVGGSGTADKVTYASASSPVTVSLDGVGNDGVRGDAQNIAPDVEILEGTALADTITGSNADKSERYIGGGGNDTITGLGGSDVFHEGAVPSGSDTYNGGAGIDLIDYSARTAGVNVTLDLSRNDGAPGEGDFINPNVNDVFGSNGPDVITGTSGANTINAHAGDDEIVALGGDDRLIGGPGRDRLFANAGNDIVEAVDNTSDHIRCDVGADTLFRDRFDSDHLGCDTINSVIFGTLGFAPKALTAKVGETAKLRLSWTHPESWKQVRAVTLKLRLRDKVVGSITMRPRGERISRAGAVQLVRRASRVSHSGRKVTARLAMRLAPALAGKTLRAEVKAVDTRGRKQVERDAGTIQVTR